MTNSKPRLIAFYLPQYHPIPENDAWWGKGFTEWTNVVKAKPLFPGHYQPHLPADLGFYDLRVPEVREQQAAMARDAGIEGFCYWHYWFAGKQLLERPFNEVLASGKPDFPFCLAWANQSWTGIWHGAPDRLLIEQTYPGESDHIAHFLKVLPAFQDNRYILIDGKPIFIIYKPNEIPNPQDFIDLWQKLAIKNGLPGIYFIGMRNSYWTAVQNGFNGIIFDTLSMVRENFQRHRTTSLERYLNRLRGIKKNRVSNLPVIYDHHDLFGSGLPELISSHDEYQTIFPNWDNTPRSGLDGFVYSDSSPENFKKQLVAAIKQIESRPKEKQIVFIKSWNEWAEGNYLEPDQRDGMGFLNVIRRIMASNES